MSELDLVIFDCDGVLVDSVAISCELLARSLSAAGLPTTPEEARRDYAELLLADVVSRAQAKLGRALPEDWLERYEGERELAFSLELRPIPGAGEAVQRITAAGVTVCVASQGKLEKTRLSLSLTGLRGLFAEDALFSAYEVLRGKPEPDLLLHAARLMKAPAGRCAVIEDMPSGVQAAVSPGMRAFGYAAAGDEPAQGDATALARTSWRGGGLPIAARATGPIGPRRVAGGHRWRSRR